jgi:hypothetical protein
MTEVERAVESIKAAAEAKWGDNWLHMLTKSHNAIYHPKDNQSKAYSARWTQFRRIMEEGQQPQGETLLRLAKSAGLKKITL